MEINYNLKYQQTQINSRCKINYAANLDKLNFYLIDYLYQSVSFNADI